MNREGVGYVIEVFEDKAKVKVSRHSNCKSCGACPGSDALVVLTENKLNAKVGDKVKFVEKENQMLTSIYIVYLQPILLTFIGIGMGKYIKNYFHNNTYIFEIIFGVLFLSISIIHILRKEKYLASLKENNPEITNILN